MPIIFAQAIMFIPITPVSYTHLIKKGDTVYVNSGEDKGKTGRVLKVLVKEGRAIVEGINMVSKSCLLYTSFTLKYLKQQASE